MNLSELRGLTDATLSQGSDKWHLLRRACADSLFFFIKAVWSSIPPSRNLMSLSCHLPVCLALEDDSLKRLLIEWPRRHMKSTIVSESYPVWKLVREVVNGNDPNNRFGIYSSTTTNSQRFWRSIRTGFESNELFQFLFPELIPDFSKVKLWNESEGKVPRAYDPKEPTFDCLGGGKATSRHYDEIVEDDMINEENFDSPSGVAKAVEFHRQAENLLESASMGRIITVGNRWAMFDLNHTIHREEPNTAILSASYKGINLTGDYSCRNLPESVMEVLHKYKDGDILWPERFTQEDFDNLLRKQKPRIFSCQYLNSPSDPDSVDFRQEWLKYCSIERDAELGWVIHYEDDKHPVPLSRTNLYITWDPALDGKSSTSRNAVVVCTIDHLGRVAIIEDYAKKEDPLKTIDSFISMAKRYAGFLKASGVEEVLFQRVLGKLLRDRARAKGVTLSIRKIKTPQGQRKDQRIRAWTGTLFEDGKVYIRSGCNRFIDEYLHYGVQGMTVDILDAFAYATQIWTKPIIDDDEQLLLGEVPEQVMAERGITGYGTALSLA